MSRFIDLTGQRFGKWLALARVKSSKSGNSMFKCVCDCGNEKDVLGNSLRKGVSTGCGLGGCHFMAKRPYEAIYNRIITDAKIRKIEVELTYEQFIKFITENPNCDYCGASVIRAEHSKNHKTGIKQYRGHGLDRKDNALGYSLSNIVTCCPSCNIGKMNQYPR